MICRKGAGKKHKDRCAATFVMWMVAWSDQAVQCLAQALAMVDLRTAVGSCRAMSFRHPCGSMSDPAAGTFTSMLNRRRSFSLWCKRVCPGVSNLHQLATIT